LFKRERPWKLRPDEEIGDGWLKAQPIRKIENGERRAKDIETESPEQLARALRCTKYEKKYEKTEFRRARKKRRGQ